MGLGIVALGFLLLEGFRLHMNALEIYPNYICYTIIIIGLLCIRKRVKIKKLDIAFILGLILIFFDVIEYANSYLDILFEIINYAYMVILLLGIIELVKDDKIKHVLHFYIGIITLMRILTFLAGNEVFLFLLNCLFIVKLISCYVVTFMLYRKNKKIEEDYENTPVKYKYKFNKYVAIICMLLGLTGIYFIREPLIHGLRDNVVKTYHWYGEVEDKIIVNRMSILHASLFEGDHDTFAYPYIYINDEDYKKTKYYSMLLKYHDGYTDTFIELSEATEREDTNKNGYHLLIPEDDKLNFDYKELYKYRKELTGIITLYDKNKQIYKVYEINLNNSLDKIKTYSYVDEMFEIKDLKVEDNFIVQLPSVHVNDITRENYMFFISGDEKFDLSGNHPNLTYLTMTFSDDVEYELNHYYHEKELDMRKIPKQETYYLHITDENRKLIKTVKLIEQ